MKKLIAFLLIVALISCNDRVRDYEEKKRSKPLIDEQKPAS